jgi:hypothetical protein
MRADVRGIVSCAAAVVLLTLAWPSPPAMAADAGSCETDIVCVDPAHVAFGTWPACGCRDGAAGNASGGSDGVHPGSAGVQACNDLFICPPSFAMDVQNDTCLCKPD